MIVRTILRNASGIAKALGSPCVEDPHPSEVFRPKSVNPMIACYSTVQRSSRVRLIWSIVHRRVRIGWEDRGKANRNPTGGVPIWYLQRSRPHCGSRLLGGTTACAPILYNQHTSPSYILLLLTRTSCRKAPRTFIQETP